jgi:hypothetical protein
MEWFNVTTSCLRGTLRGWLLLVKIVSQHRTQHRKSVVQMAQTKKYILNTEVLYFNKTEEFRRLRLAFSTKRHQLSDLVVIRLQRISHLWETTAQKDSNLRKSVSSLWRKKPELDDILGDESDIGNAMACAVCKSVRCSLRLLFTF